MSSTGTSTSGPVPAAFADVFPGRITQLDPDDDKTWNTELGLNIKFGDSPLGLNLNGQYSRRQRPPITGT